jgi:carbamoyl-phosphate synthase large subunit
MKFLVTGAGGPAGTNIINYFPKTETVIACDADPGARKRLARIGKGRIKFYRVPLARDDSFQSELTKIVDSEKPDYIIPTVDEELAVLSESNAAFMNRVIISPPKTIKTCLDKKNLYDFFEGEPFCPFFVSAYNRSQLEEAFEDRPLFMKPRVGRGSRGTDYFDNVEAVPDKLINTDNIFCEFLPGQEYTADVMCDMKGKPLVIVPRKRLDTEQGISVLGETEKRADLIEIIKEICGELVFVGGANMQFKLDCEGKPKLVEVNPRFSGGLPITVAAGINPVEIMVEILHKRKIGRNMLLWSEVRAENRIAKKIGRDYKQP